MTLFDPRGGNPLLQLLEQAGQVGQGSTVGQPLGNPLLQGGIGSQSFASPISAGVGGGTDLGSLLTSLAQALSPQALGGQGIDALSGRGAGGKLSTPQLPDLERLLFGTAGPTAEGQALADTLGRLGTGLAFGRRGLAESSEASALDPTTGPAPPDEVAPTRGEQRGNEGKKGRRQKRDFAAEVATFFGPAPQQAIPTGVDFSRVLEAFEKGRPTEPGVVGKDERLLRVLSALAGGASRGQRGNVGNILAFARASGLGTLGDIKQEGRLNRDEFRKEQQAFEVGRARLETQIAQQQAKEQNLVNKVEFENTQAVYNRGVDILKASLEAQKTAATLDLRRIQGITAEIALRDALQPGRDFNVLVGGVRNSIKDLPVEVQTPILASVMVMYGAQNPELLNMATEMAEKDNDTFRGETFVNRNSMVQDAMVKILAANPDMLDQILANQKSNLGIQ